MRTDLMDEESLTAAASAAETIDVADGPATSRQKSGLSPSTVMWGVAASVLLVVFYALVMTVTEGFDAAVELLQADWYLIVPLVASFGVQAGFFAYVRGLQRANGKRSAGALTGANTGISGVSMLACCVHHLADLLPFLGLSGLALFLGQYREPLMILGIASNLAGIAFMLRMISRARAGGMRTRYTLRVP